MKLNKFINSNRLLQLYNLFLFLFILSPTIIVFLISFNESEFISFPPKTLSFRWYKHIYDTQLFNKAILNSFKLAFLSTGISTFLGLLAAFAMVRYQFKFKDLIYSFLLSPLSLPMLVIGSSLLIYTNRIGLGLSFLSLLIGHVIICIPYIVRTVTGTYMGVDRNIEDCARILGASELKVFFYITLPIIKSGIIAGFIFSFLTSFDNVPISIFLTKTETTTLPISIYSYLLYNFDPSIAAISTIQLLFVIIAMLIADKYYGLKHFTAFGQ